MSDRIALVVQRYGADVTGGSEALARALAERLAADFAVTVFTTCARDYVTWRNELPEGVEQVHSVPVRRFPVRHQGEPREFGRRSERVFGSEHSVPEQLAWLEREGPATRK